MGKFVEGFVMATLFFGTLASFSLINDNKKLEEEIENLKNGKEA